MLTMKEQEKVKVLVQKHGIKKAAELLGVHKTSLLRIAAGMPVRPTTESVLHRALAEVR